MKLYNSPLSPNCKRVKICAAELGVALDVHDMDIRGGEQRTPAYLALNPVGKIPTLTDGDFALWESGAILWYLATKHAGSAILPSEPMAQADTLRWMFFGSCHLDPYFTTLVVERFIKGRRNEPENAGLTADAEKNLTRFVAVVDAALAEREFLTGRFSIADILVGSSLELAPVLRFDLAPYPHVRQWLERLQARPSWKSASAG